MKKLLISFCIPLILCLSIPIANADTIVSLINSGEKFGQFQGVDWGWLQTFSLPSNAAINSATLEIYALNVNFGEDDMIYGDTKYLGNLVQGGNEVTSPSTTIFNLSSYANDLLDGSMAMYIDIESDCWVHLVSSKLTIDYSLQRDNPTEAPEPMTLLLVGSGMLGLAGLKRKFKK